MPARKSPKPHSIALPTQLDGAAVAALRDELLGCRGSAVALDAGSVRKLGGLGAQLLLAAARSWRADGQPLTLAAASPEFSEALRLLGLTPEVLIAGEAR